MKGFLKAYFTFNKAERLGIIALMTLIVLLGLVRIFMHNFVAVEPDRAAGEKLANAWQEFKAANKKTELNILPASTPVITKKAEKEDVKTVIAVSTLFPFDPNTIDSAGLRKLGLREKTTSIFLHWRAKGKKFYRKEELRKLYTLTEEEYLRLEPYIIIDNNKP